MADRGADCAPVLDCGRGWSAAVAFADSRQAVRIGRETDAIALAGRSCMVAVNGHCKARLSIGPDGGVNRDVTSFNSSAGILQLLLPVTGKEPDAVDGTAGHRSGGLPA